MISEADLIHIKDYAPLCDFIYDHENMKVEPESGIILVHTDNIQKFFRDCRRHKYVVVSPESDFSLFYQADHHPNTDLRRVANYLKFAEAAKERNYYVQMKLGPACNSEKCDVKDRYSIKTYCWTAATFPEIPSNIVRWYCANTHIVDDPRIEWIPYGLADGRTPPLALRHSPRRKLLYVNFELYTDERMALKAHFEQQRWATVVPEANLPPDRYYQDIAEHKFVLCPAGNGLDCYRNYESIYLGAYPVMWRTPFTKHFEKAGLPVLLVDNYAKLTPTFLEAKYEEMRRSSWDFSQVKLSTWESRLEGARRLLQ